MTYAQYIGLRSYAVACINNGDSFLKVETGNAQSDFYFNLPSPQTSGTYYQRMAYAKQAATKFLANHGFNEPSNNIFK